MITCPTCAGYGEVNQDCDPSEIHPCPICNGTGKITSPKPTEAPTDSAAERARDALKTVVLADSWVERILDALDRAGIDLVQREEQT